MSDDKKIARPNRDPDYYSKRNVAYWFHPEWCRGTSADLVYDELHPLLREGTILNSNGQFVTPCSSYGKIYAVREGDDVVLYMKSKMGKLTYIQGSMQREFKKWHQDREIDYILLGMNPDEIIANQQD